jgi:hypothetical protein
VSLADEIGGRRPNTFARRENYLVNFIGSGLARSFKSDVDKIEPSDLTARPPLDLFARTCEAILATGTGPGSVQKLCSGLDPPLDAEQLFELHDGMRRAARGV